MILLANSKFRFKCTRTLWSTKCTQKFKVWPPKNKTETCLVTNCSRSLLCYFFSCSEDSFEENGKFLNYAKRLEIDKWEQKEKKFSCIKQKEILQASFQNLCDLKIFEPVLYVLKTCGKEQTQTKIALENLTSIVVKITF